MNMTPRGVLAGRTQHPRPAGQNHATRIGCRFLFGHTVGSTARLVGARITQNEGHMSGNRLRCGLLAAFAATALTACGHSVASVDTSAPTNVCSAIESLQPDTLLGGTPAKHRACQPDDASGSLGVAVWTAATGRRVSVSVIDNAKAGPGVAVATFDAVYQNAPAALRCTAAVSGHDPLRCVDKTNTGQTETGTFILDEGATYLVVWLSDENGQSAGIDIPPAERPGFAAFVTEAVKAIYGTTVRLPDTGPAPLATQSQDTASPDTGTTSSPTEGWSADSVTAELTKQGYQRSARARFPSAKAGRQVTTEDWTAPAFPNLPTVHLSDAPPGALGKPAIASVSYDNGVGPYHEFSCVPASPYIFSARTVIEQAGIARRLALAGSAPPAGASGTSMTSVDGSVTCHLK